MELTPSAAAAFDDLVVAVLAGKPHPVTSRTVWRELKRDGVCCELPDVRNSFDRLVRRRVLDFEAGEFDVVPRVWLRPGLSPLPN